MAIAFANGARRYVPYNDSVAAVWNSRVDPLYQRDTAFTCLRDAKADTPVDYNNATTPVHDVAISPTSHFLWSLRKVRPIWAYAFVVWGANWGVHLSYDAS